MNTNLFARGRRLILWGIVVGVAFVVSPSVCQAGFVVKRGFDLYQILPGTSFLGQDFQGVPAYGFNFGGPVGYRRLGASNTSMIVRRLGKAVGSADGTASVKVKLSYFLLRTTTQVDFRGNGMGYYYLTLQTGKGRASMGSYTIHYNSDGSGGTYDATITLNYVLRKGNKKTGAVVLRGTTTLSMQGAFWSRNPVTPPGTTLIRYINRYLNGRSTLADFFATQPFDWTTTGGDTFTTALASPFRI